MKVKYYTSIFKLEALPLDAIHVIDNWCPKDMWQEFNEHVENTHRWSYDNDVTYEDGETTEITLDTRLFKKWMTPQRRLCRIF